MPKIFLSYRHADAPDMAGRIYDRLVGRFSKENVFKDVQRIKLGEDFREALAEAAKQCDALIVLIGKGWLSASDSAGQRRLDDPADYVRIEIEWALARGILTIPVLVHAVAPPKSEELPETIRNLAYLQAARVRSDPDFETDIRHLIDRLIDQPTSETETPVPQLGDNPYRGLSAFREEDARLFYGRTRQVARVTERLESLFQQRADRAIRVVPILGPSGCGKSSIARAGVVGRLADAPLTGCKAMCVTAFTPGARPLESLANALARVVSGDATSIEKSNEFLSALNAADDGVSCEGLRRIADMLPGVSERPLLLVIDQFEEIYTHCEDDVQRRAFIDHILCAASDVSGHCSVLLTLRSDFLADTQNHSELNNVIAWNGLIIPKMSADELRSAIVQPAKQAGYEFDDVVVDRLVNESIDREGALPLLQYALTRIWEGLARGMRPADTLKQIGGVGGALASEAQRIFNALPEDEKAVARRVFLGLVQLGEGSPDTRRRVRVDHLLSHKDNPATLRGVLDQFSAARSRLITVFAAPSAANDTLAEITHEALLEHWRELRGWLDASRDRLRFLRRLADAAGHWSTAGRPRGLLWRSPNLERLARFYEESGDDFSPAQMEFMRASQADARRRRLIRRLNLAAILSAAAIVLMTLAWVQWSRLEEQQRRGEATKIKEDIAALIAPADWLPANGDLVQEKVQDLGKVAPDVVEEVRQKIDERFIHGVAASIDNLYSQQGPTEEAIRASIDIYVRSFPDSPAGRRAHDLLARRVASRQDKDVAKVLATRLTTATSEGTPGYYLTGKRLSLPINCSSWPLGAYVRFECDLTVRDDLSHPFTVALVGGTKERPMKYEFVLQPANWSVASSKRLEASIRVNGAIAKTVLVPRTAAPLHVRIERKSGNLLFQVAWRRAVHCELFTDTLRPAKMSIIVPQHVIIAKPSLTFRPVAKEFSELERADTLASQGQYVQANQIYRRLADVEPGPTNRLGAQATVKHALTGLRLEGETEHAIAALAGIVRAETTPWSAVAAFELFRRAVLQGRLAEAEVWFAHLTPQPEAMLRRWAPKDLSHALNSAMNAKSTIPARLQIKQSDLRYLEMLMQAIAFVQPPDRHRLRLNLAIAFAVVGRDERAYDILSGMLPDRQFLRPELMYETLYYYGWLAIRTKHARSALQVLTKEAALLPMESAQRASLRCRLARLRLAMGDSRSKREARKLLDATRKRRKMPAVAAQAALLYGFLLDHDGDSEGAMTAWKDGFTLIRLTPQRASDTFLILGSLTGNLTAADVRACFEQNVSQQGSSFAAAKLVLDKLTTGLMAEITAGVRDMYQDARGRQYAERIAKRNIGVAEMLTVQAKLGIYHTIRHAAFEGSLSKDEEDLIWNFVQRGIHAWRIGELKTPALVAVLYTWWSSTTAITFDLVPSALRGPLAFILGHRFESQGKKKIAAFYYKAAVQSAKDNEKLRELSERGLKQLENDSAPVAVDAATAPAEAP